MKKKKKQIDEILLESESKKIKGLKTEIYKNFDTNEGYVIFYNEETEEQLTIDLDKLKEFIGFSRYLKNVNLKQYSKK